MIITILVDSVDSWYVPYATMLREKLIKINNKVKLVHKKDKVMEGDICFLLSCVKIVEKEILERNTHNIVVHASDLPQGQGFSPMKWQIFEGKNHITLTLFEATEKVDKGGYYFKESLDYTGYELLDELQSKMAKKINEMCIQYVSRIDDYALIQQKGIATWYPRFTDDDDKLDINMTLLQHFNHLRIEDNDNHPLWFEIDGNRYYLKIYRA